MFAKAFTKRNIVRAPEPLPPPSAGDGVTIRRSGPGDGPAIWRLGRLEDRRPARGPYVLAERAGDVVAAGPPRGGGPPGGPLLPPPPGGAGAGRSGAPPPPGGAWGPTRGAPPPV